MYDEVIRFAAAGPLLRPSAALGREDRLVIEDFSEAQEYAYRRYLTDADDALNWLDLRARQDIVGAPLSDAEMDVLSTERMALCERLYELLPARLPLWYSSIVNDVVGDLGNCAYFRSIFGDGDRLFDRIWRAYLQGGWPCGWIGNYSAGSLVVFSPAAR